jgi:hypothetical protein
MISQPKWQRAVGLAVGLIFAASIGVGTVGAYARDDHRGGDRRDYGHDRHGDRGYYAPPPVVYGSPYYAPPVVYGPGINIHIP